MFTGKIIQLSELAKYVGADIHVKRDCKLAYVGKIPSLVAPRIVPCATPQHICEMLSETGISGVVTTEDLADEVPSSMGLGIAKKPLKAAYLLHEYLCSQNDFHWKSFPTRISNTAKIHPTAVIAENDVVIEDGCIIHPHVVIYPRTIIGMNTTVGAGSIVGCDAFEVNASNEIHKILKQAGGVRIGENVDIQAKCTVVRSTFGGFTEIGDETKFDCHVHLAHDCVVGKRVRITAAAEISGRVTIHDEAYLGPNVSISNGVSIGKRAHVSIGSVVTRDVPDESHVSGNFAIDHVKWLNLIRKIR